MAERYINMIVDTLRSKNRFFDEYDTSNPSMVILTYKDGENVDEIKIYISVGILDDGTILANFSCYDLPNFSNHLMKGYQACNYLNNEETVKYYIDNDGDAVVTMTEVFGGFGYSDYFSPDHILSLAIRITQSVDEAYPILERAKLN